MANISVKQTNSNYPYIPTMQYKAFDDTGTYTETLVSGKMYLLIIGKSNAANANAQGLYIVTSHSGSPFVTPIKESTVATVTMSGVTMSVNFTDRYMRYALIMLSTL